MTNGCWVIDRKISLGFILAIAVHAISVVAWLVRVDSRVGELERTDSRHDTAIVEMQRTHVTMEGMRSDIAWIKSALQGRGK